MKDKYFAIGFLSGLVVGFLFLLLYPQLLKISYIYNLAGCAQSTPVPNYCYSVTGGTPVNVMILMPLFFGLIGSGIGIVVAQIIKPHK